MSKDILVELSTVLGAITHELSGPLGIFISCHELLSRNALPAEQVANLLIQGVEEQKKTLEILRGLANLSAPFGHHSLLEMLNTVFSGISLNFIVELKIPEEMYFYAPNMAYSFFWEMFLVGIDDYGVSQLEISKPFPERAEVALLFMGGRLKQLENDLQNIFHRKFELLGKAALLNFALPLTIIQHLSSKKTTLSFIGETDKLEVFVGI